MTLDDSILARRLHVMRRAHELGNVTAACREAGISRTLFYRWRARFERYGPDGLHPWRQHARPGRLPQVPPHVELRARRGPWRGDRCRDVCRRCRRTWSGRSWGWRWPGRPGAVAGWRPTWGARGCAWPPAPSSGSSGGPGWPPAGPAWACWSTTPPGPAACSPNGRAWRFPRVRPARHVHTRQPGELVSLDTFYVGKLKGVGKIWQITACDAACSSGVAWLLPAFTAEAAAAFLTQHLGPLYRRAGWPLQRVLTDGGAEFRGAFDEACQRLGIRHTRTRPRHAWTNGFVERLQGTILYEHWRIQFRRQYFTGRRAMQRTLDAFMKFYNEQRLHQGYRLRGRTPAALFWGAAAPTAS